MIEKGVFFMRCPVDNETLIMADRNGVEIDYCPTCRGVWLDRGELDKIIDRASGVAPVAAPVAAPLAAPAMARGAGGQPVPLREPADTRAADTRLADHGRHIRRDDDDDDDRRGGHRKKRREGFLSELFDF